MDDFHQTRTFMLTRSDVKLRLLAGDIVLLGFSGTEMRISTIIATLSHTITLPPPCLGVIDSFQKVLPLLSHQNLCSVDPVDVCPEVSWIMTSDLD